MAIIGFIFLVIITLYLSAGVLAMLSTAAAWGGGLKGGDLVATLFMLAAAITVGYFAYTHAPFHITFS